MLPYQERVVAEHNDLTDKLGKLGHFIASLTFDALSKDERCRLIRQHAFMSGYAAVLAERISVF